MSFLVSTDTINDTTGIIDRDTLGLAQHNWDGSASLIGRIKSTNVANLTEDTNVDIRLIFSRSARLDGSEITTGWLPLADIATTGMVQNSYLNFYYDLGAVAGWMRCIAIDVRFKNPTTTETKEVEADFIFGYRS